MNKVNPRILSRLGLSGAVFGMALPEYVSQKEQVKVVSADMSRPAGLDRYKSQYPQNFYNAGIAEQNMMGIAAGLSSEGYKSIAVAQACFISMRSFEQIRQYMGYMQFPIICVGINSGFSLTFFGNTHYAIEDIALMRTIPNMIVLSPSDSTMAVALFEKALECQSAVYIRLHGGLNIPIIYNDQPDVTLGGSTILRDGNDITILTTGPMVYQALQVADLLSEGGIEAKVVDMYSIKPIDKELIAKSAEAKLIVTIEEHNIIGGLGGAVAEILSELNCQTRLLRLGITDKFNQVGDYAFLLEQNRLTKDLLLEDILKELNDF